MIPLYNTGNIYYNEANMTQLSLRTFLRKYNTNEACLEEIKNYVFPNGITCPQCKQVILFYKLTGRMAYSCGICRAQVYPHRL